MTYRASDAREAELAIRQYWQRKAKASAVDSSQYHDQVQRLQGQQRAQADEALRLRTENVRLHTEIDMLRGAVEQLRDGFERVRINTTRLATEKRAVEADLAALRAHNDMLLEQAAQLREELVVAWEVVRSQEGRKAVRAADALNRLRGRTPSTLGRAPVPEHLLRVPDLPMITPEPVSAPAGEILEPELATELVPDIPTSAAAATSVPVRGISSPAFSVLMPVYNKGDLVRAAVASVRNQTLPDWELLVWDDGSTDPQTLQALDAIEGPGVRVFHSHNEGVVKARNHLAQRARGQFLIFLDPDDELLPSYLEKALFTFTGYPEVDVVVPTARVLSDEDGVWPYWFPPPFEERRLAYENTAPISSAFRAHLWDEVGGVPVSMESGYEDWHFWRRCAHNGARGRVLEDALFLYRYTESGRASELRRRHDTLVREIKQISPLIDHPPAELTPAPGAVSQEVEHRAFHVAHDARESLIVFMPWLIMGSGSDRFLQGVLRALSEEMRIVVISTEARPEQYRSDLNAYLEITPYVYDLPGLVPPGDFPAVVQSLVYRMAEPTILNMGSPWAYHYLSRIRGWKRGFGRVIDFHFNHIGHLAELLDHESSIDQVLVCNAHLKDLLSGYFELTTPIDVVYVAPKEPADLPEWQPHDQLVVGWLGRNSSEKRPDLLIELARMLPDVRFILAGTGFEGVDSPVPNLRMQGYVTDVTGLMKDIDLLINTSDVEGISVSAMEALQMGVPVATRDVGGMSELVEDGYNGFVYDARDLRGLAARITDAGQLEAVQKGARTSLLPAQFHETAMMAVMRRAILKKVWQ